jgi:hypothetical protein
MTRSNQEPCGKTTGNSQVKARRSKLRGIQNFNSICPLYTMNPSPLMAKQGSLQRCSQFVFSKTNNHDLLDPSFGPSVSPYLFWQVSRRDMLQFLIQ